MQQVREYLPQMESELKFKSLPEDEVAIIHLIEQHEVGAFAAVQWHVLSHIEHTSVLAYGIDIC